MPLSSTEDAAVRKLEDALETTESDRVKYHLRQALQLQLIEAERDLDKDL